MGTETCKGCKSRTRLQTILHHYTGFSSGVQYTTIAEGYEQKPVLWFYSVSFGIFKTNKFKC